MNLSGNKHWRWVAVLMVSLGAVALVAIASSVPSVRMVIAGDEPPAGASTGAALADVQPSAPYTVNVPLLEAAAGDAEYDANNWAVVWFGKVSSDENNYGDLRVLGRVDGLQVRIQLYDVQTTAGDVVTFELNGRSWRVPYSGAEGWEIGERCEGGGCRGWGADALIPWSEFGGRPQAGDVWPLRVTFTDADKDPAADVGVDNDSGMEEATSPSTWPPGGTGLLHWGLPAHAVRSVDAAQVLEVDLSADSMVGGGTDCASQDWPEFFPTWGKRNFGPSGHVNVQMQWDIADWPCYAKYYAAWSLAELPAGAEIISATVEMRQFGNPGYGPGYADNGTKDTVMQVFEVDKGWKEMTITWDNAPIPRENTGRTLVRPLPGDCEPTPYWFCSPGIPYMFDVTQIVKRAQADRRGWASLALYTAAGQYHSGKFFWSREGDEPPIVRIGYLPVEDTRPVGATAPAQDGTSGRQSPAAQPVPVKPTATVKPQLAPAVLPTVTPTVTPTATSALKSRAGRTYYISPGGNDSNNGSTAELAWGTFERAWESMQPGDTLLLLDGVYTGVMWPNMRNGEPGQPITIKALNDGQAVIDGEGARIPVRIGEVWGPNGPVGNYYVVEGLVIRNGTYATMRVEGSHNVVRRVSLYNASTDENSTVLWVSAGGNNLIEDCVAAGTGRYMIELYEGKGGNTVRRCLAMWQEWNGRRFCGIHWPNGQGIGVYNTSNNTVENSISYGRATLGFLLQANSDTAVATNNHILGSLSLLAGADYDGSPWYYGSPTLQPTTRPHTQTAEGTSCDGNYAQWNWGNQRTGFQYWGQGTLQDNVFRDIVAAGNLGVGWGGGYPGGAGPVNTVIDHATLYDNGSDITSWENDLGGNIHLDRGSAGVTITNSRIANSDWAEQGEGARLQYRYVDRQLTDQPLWPWPMEKRIQAELGVSVTKLVAKYRGEAPGQ